MAEAIAHNALKHGKPLSSFRKGTVVRGAPRMALRRGYTYTLEADPGADFDPTFKPALTPGEILFMGAFEGAYLNDCTSEFPQEWFLYAAAAGRLSPGEPNVKDCNYFGVASRQPLSVWRENGWVPSRTRKARKGIKGRDILSDASKNPDERGWFQWYCRYWLGRRIPDLDSIQIGRWRSFIARHTGGVRAGCRAGDLECRPRERQALLQWAANPFV